MTWVQVALICAVIIFLVIEASSGRNDLDIFLAASCDLFLGKNIYTNTYFDGYHYYYSVFFASLIHPLVFLSPFWSKLIWLSVNMLLIFRIQKLITWFFDESTIAIETRTLLICLVFIFCLRFFKGNLHLGQLTIVMLALSLESVYRTMKNQDLIGSMLLALAINIKLLPIVFLPYLIYRAKWKMIVFTGSALIFFYLVPAFWIGFENTIFLFNEWWVLVNPNDQRHIMDLEESSFHSLTTLFAALFTDTSFDPVGLQTKWNVARFSGDQLFILINVVRLALIAFTLWFLRSIPFSPFSSKQKTWWEVSYLLLLVPLIFPHQQHYAFLMTLPAVVWILHWFLAENPSGLKRRVLISLVFLIYLSFNLSLLLGALNAYYNHYKILTFGALCLMFLLAYTKPTKSSSVLD